MPGHSFSKAERLRKKPEFLAARQGGTRYFTKSFIIYIRPNDLGIRRLGISASSKVGKAVKRNRIKRLIREVFRLNKESFPPSVDIFIIAKRGINPEGYFEVEAELMGFLKKI